MLGRSKLVYEIGCFLLALYMTAIMTNRFLENKDATSITFKRYNESPREKYPSFSICFTGTQFYWYYYGHMANVYGITPQEYEKILVGQPAFIHDYLHSSRLYKKLPVNLNNFSDSLYDQFHVQFRDVVTEVEFLTKNANHYTYYGPNTTRTSTQDPPFYIGYQTPTTICFTRNTCDHIGSRRMQDMITFNMSTLARVNYINTEIQVIVHYPEHLLKSMNMPSYTSTFSSLHGNIPLEFKLSSGSLLRKRPDSLNPCNPGIEDYDEYLLLSIARKINCIPPYWKYRIKDKNLDISPCESSQQLKDVYHYQQTIMDTVESYDKPCVEMFISSTSYWDVMHRTADFYMKFIYEDKYFQEIEYTRSFGLESFISNVGGFIGIFLGYSIMQFPEFLGFFGKNHSKFQFRNILIIWSYE